MKKSRTHILLGFLTLIFCMGIFAGKARIVSADEYLCPESNSRYLTEDEIKDFTLQELNYAKNEVYARHGYKFKSTELTEYYSQFGWYEGTIPGSKFDESVLNKYENRNISLLSRTEHKKASNGYALDKKGYDITAVRTFVNDYADELVDFDSLIRSMRIGNVERLGNAFSMDLDNDGKKENIRLSFDDEEEDENFYYGDYTLSVNNVSTSSAGANVRHDVYGVCLGTKDIYLIVFQDGPSDDPIAEFYRWKKNKLIYAGEIEVYIDDITTDGHGFITGWTRSYAMDTNFMHGEWELGEDGYLYLAGSGQYEMSRKEYELKKQIRVYESNDKSSRSRKIDPQSISVEYTDGGDWVYIKAANGKWGWYNAGELSYEQKMNTFGGMLFAD